MIDILIVIVPIAALAFAIWTGLNRTGWFAIAPFVLWFYSFVPGMRALLQLAGGPLSRVAGIRPFSWFSLNAESLAFGILIVLGVLLGILTSVVALRISFPTEAPEEDSS